MKNKMQLFQYATLLHPTEEQAKLGKKTELLKFDTILASSKESAMVLASRSIPEDQLEDLDQVEVILRPF
jgi:hypothetical protein